EPNRLGYSSGQIYCTILLSLGKVHGLPKRLDWSPKLNEKETSMLISVFFIIFATLPRGLLWTYFLVQPGLVGGSRSTSGCSQSMLRWVNGLEVKMVEISGPCAPSRSLKASKC